MNNILLNKGAVQPTKFSNTDTGLSVWLHKGAVQPAAVPAAVPPTTGGRSKKSQRPRRYIVEIDNKFIEVSNITEAQAVLQQARDLADEAARADVSTPVTPKPPRVTVKTIKGNQTTSKVLKQDIKRTQNAILKAYRKAADAIARDQEIAKRIQQQIAEDDENDAITALLLS